MKLIRAQGSISLDALPAAALCKSQNTTLSCTGQGDSTRMWLENPRKESHAYKRQPSS